MELAPISAVIISKNESAHIKRAIISLQSLCKEVILVDSGSTDGTQAIAQELGAVVLDQPWQGYAKTKNIGNGHASQPWILSLDADEALSEDLSQAIRRAVSNGKSAVYGLNRLNHFAEKPIYYGGWNPDWQWRLFEKSKVSWNETHLVHEQLQIPEGLACEKLSGYLLHYTTPDYSSYLQKMKKYASIYRDKRTEAGLGSNRLKGYTSAYFRLVKELVLQKGILDGMAGWQIAKAHFWYTVWKYANQEKV
jgi:glycosyltransferase involved in cell wall biosynthesis